MTLRFSTTPGSITTPEYFNNWVNTSTNLSDFIWNPKAAIDEHLAHIKVLNMSHDSYEAFTTLPFLDITDVLVRHPEIRSMIVAETYVCAYTANKDLTQAISPHVLDEELRQLLQYMLTDFALTGYKPILNMASWINNLMDSDPIRYARLFCPF